MLHDRIGPDIATWRFGRHAWIVGFRMFVSELYRIKILFGERTPVVFVTMLGGGRQREEGGN